MPGIPLYFWADCLRSSHPVSWRCSCKGNAQQQAPLVPPLEPPPATPQPQPPGSPSVTAFVKSSWMPQSQTVVFPQATPQPQPESYGATGSARRQSSAAHRFAMGPPVPLNAQHVLEPNLVQSAGVQQHGLRILARRQRSSWAWAIGRRSGQHLLVFADGGASRGGHTDSHKVVKSYAR